MHKKCKTRTQNNIMLCYKWDAEKKTNKTLARKENKTLARWQDSNIEDDLSTCDKN